MPADDNVNKAGQVAGEIGTGAAKGVAALWQWSQTHTLVASCIASFVAGFIVKWIW